MTIAFIMSTIAGIFNMTVCPAVSFKSDRYRGKRWGRRIVFIVGTLPMMCLALLGFATSGVAGEFLAGVLKPLGEFAPATIIVVLLGIMMVFWQFFYMFIGSVIYYIYSDVIPTQFLARAVGMVQVAAVAAATVVNLFLLKYANTHFSQLMVLAAIVYFLAVGAMCLFLKEPELPPLAEDELKSTLGPRGIFTFVKESFSHRFYWFNTFANSFWSVGTGCIGTFLIFFYMALGMDLETIGNLNGINGLVGMVLGMAMATGVLGRLLVILN
jgi:MFS family permease